MILIQLLIYHQDSGGVSSSHREAAYTVLANAIKITRFVEITVKAEVESCT